MSTPQARSSSGQTDQQPARIGLRLARVGDLVALYDLLVHYFDDLKFHYPPPSRPHCLAWFLSVIAEKCCIIAEEDGVIIGSIGLEVSCFQWAPPEKFLNGTWFYVEPRRRRGGTAERFVNAAKEIAEKNQLPLRLGNMFGIEPELQDRYLQMHGFQYAGGNHVWFPPTPPARSEPEG